MPVHSHHNAPADCSQSPHPSTDSWSSEVVPRLPAQLDTQARLLKAFQRKRAFQSASDLLRGIIVFALNPFGFRWLGAWGVLSELADISAPAWREALIRSSTWLLWLIGELLVANDCPVWITQRIRGRVWIVDASMIGQVGQPGDTWRLHLAFDLIAGQIAQLHLTDRSCGESLEHFQPSQGDLVLLDAGYGYRRTLAHAQSLGSDVLCPFTPSTCPLTDGQGRALDLLAWLRLDGPSLRSRIAFWSYQQQSGRVRIVAKRREAHQTRAFERRLRKKAQKSGRNVSEVAVFLCGWLLLLTTLSESEWSSEELLWLYRARWQVELLFKRLKQLLRLKQLRATSVEGATATLRALLVAWLLQEQIGSELRSLLPQSEPPVEQFEQVREQVLSSWRLALLSLETLRQQVVGSWSMARVRECLPRLRRFLVSRGGPEHQETRVRSFLAGLSDRRRAGQPVLT